MAAPSRNLPSTTDSGHECLSVFSATKMRLVYSARGKNSRRFSGGCSGFWGYK